MTSASMQLAIDAVVDVLAPPPSRYPELVNHDESFPEVEQLEELARRIVAAAWPHLLRGYLRRQVAEMGKSTDG